MTRSLSRLSLPHLSDEAVAAFADGALSPGPFGRAQHHLADCPECAEAVRDQRAARGLLRAAAAPPVPGELLERLRQLPTSSPLGGGLIGGMTVDGQPVFPAYHTRQRQAEMSAGPVARAPIAVGTMAPPLRSRRSHLPMLGASAAAAATVIVGVLAGTAATAGGSAAPNQRPAAPAESTVTVPATDTNVQVLNLTGRR